jgi:hypothetical protein
MSALPDWDRYRIEYVAPQFARRRSAATTTLRSRCQGTSSRLRPTTRLIVAETPAKRAGG